MGFVSTRTAAANRQLRLGRLTAISLVSQAGTLIVIIAPALVWSLVIGGLVGSVITVVPTISYPWHCA